jgi:hypothetical protein
VPIVFAPTIAISASDDHHEKGAGLASLPRADTEQLEKGRPGDQHIEKCRQKGADKQGLRHENAPDEYPCRLCQCPLSSSRPR